MGEENKEKINVLVVDDSAIIRGSIIEMLESQDDINIVGSVENGELCLKKLEKEDVDIVTLDIDMPVMDGLTALGHIAERFPEVKVIMFSTLTEKGSKETFQALSKGASDFLTKPGSRAHGGMSVKEVTVLLLEKIRGLAPKEKQREHVPDSTNVKLKEAKLHVKPSVLLIGSSTGGPDALSIFFNQLALAGASLPPVLVAQHMPPLFTEQLAKRLGFDSGIECKEGEDREIIKSGVVYIAPGDYHMVVKKDGDDTILSLNQKERINYCRPAVDPLFESAAEIYGSKILAVILTGMGRDGCDGSKTIVDKGGVVIAQDEESSVVWGMPGAVAEAGIASALLPVDQLADYVKRKIT